MIIFDFLSLFSLRDRFPYWKKGILLVIAQQKLLQNHQKLLKRGGPGHLQVVETLSPGRTSGGPTKVLFRPPKEPAADQKVTPI